jgi:stage IV sporulation protein FB
MQPNLGLTQWSIPCGTWLDVRVRISLWYPLVLPPLLMRLGWELGLTCFAILLVTTVIHEFFHILAARMTGGEGEEILLWPLGGLAFARPAGTFASQFVTPAAGPLSNLLLCLVTLPAVLRADLLRESLNPITLPIDGLSDNLLRDLLLLTFSINWLLLLINLVPAFPLDGGQMLQAVLSRRMGSGEALDLSVKTGWFAGAAIAFLGLVFNQSSIVFLGFFLLLMNMQELFRLQMQSAYGEGYGSDDFSAGYDGSESEADVPTPRQGFWERWKEQRAAAKFERETEQRAATARRVDELLDKVHRQGMEALTAEERRFLDQASNQYRTQHGGKNSS